MSHSPEDQSDTNSHEKNHTDLEITKKDLQKELDSIIDLIGLDTKKENSSVHSSNFQNQTKISQREFSGLVEANKKLQSDVNTLSDSVEFLKNEMNTIRENVRILKSKQPNTSLIDNQIYELKKSIRNLENNNLPPSGRKLMKIPGKPIVHSEPSLVEPVVQDKIEIPVKEIQVEKQSNPEELHNRRRCPTCGNGNKRYIREFVDKTNIIMSNPRIYGKLYKCGLCTTEWK